MLVNWTDILDGEIVSAAWAVAGMAAKPRTSRRTAADLDVAAWSDTEQLIGDWRAGTVANLEIPDLSEVEAAELTAALHRHEVQGALQALLAVRLTDAPETDAARAREAVRLALATEATFPPGNTHRTRGNLTTWQFPGKPGLPAGRESPQSGETPFLNWPSVTPGNRPDESTGVINAEQLSEYFDEKISALVATLEGRVGFAGLAQVRAEAYNSRIVALLGAIERQLAALADPRRGEGAEAEWLARYLRQAQTKHGYLYPPDFDRRRKVPIGDIYVTPSIHEYGATGERAYEALIAFPSEEPAPNLLDLAGRLDRTVLLGDPGGGKTTAANVLTCRFAGDPMDRVPFLITLRDYAAKVPPKWSVVEYIEQQLRASYQCPAPVGLVERLLLTGRAVVIFDGLDELLDTYRRRDVSERVEQFCSAYPLTPVLVTSRVVGYDQARLDDEQFTIYRIDRFTNDQVVEFVRKWFTSQEDTTAPEASAKAIAFLAESDDARDLRANPLLLSLMCILYRGAGSLPGDRAGIYTKCAELLLRKWDEQRELYRKVRADHLIEPTIRYLAWWLFTSEDRRVEATEKELIAVAAGFMFDLGYETQEEAWAAASEFVEFCRGRMWVFSDAGTTGDGERLYAFTHRTFMEYFAAAHLATTHDRPEDLAHAVARLQAVDASMIVSELAIKLKSDSSVHGADRIYAILLDDWLSPSPAMLWLMIRCLGSARPSPGTVRRLVRAALDIALNPGSVDGRRQILEQLAGDHGDYRPVMFNEICSYLTIMIASADDATHVMGLQLVLEFAWTQADFALRQWSKDQSSLHRAEIAAAAARSRSVRTVALNTGVLSLAEALALPGGFGALMEGVTEIFSPSSTMPYPLTLCSRAMRMTPDTEAIKELALIGRYLREHTRLDHIRSRRYSYGALPLAPRQQPPLFDELSGLGFAMIEAIVTEINKSTRHSVTLPMPAQFRRLFWEWAQGRVNFVEIIDE